MTRTKPIVFTLVTAAVVLFAVESADAKHQQILVGKPGLGVSGIGVSTVFVPAPGVPTPSVRSSSVTTPMVVGNPGVTARDATTPMITGNPGVSAPMVAGQHVATPEVATVAPAVGGLPHGYYTTIPSSAVQVVHRGDTCYKVGNVYYRPEYYMGSLVYVVVP
jgi:hypothetical protein